MATLHQALRLIKTQHYHNLIPHEKRFINQMFEGLGGMDDVKDDAVGDYISPKQERFIWYIAKRFNIYIQKQMFKPIIQKPALPRVVVNCTMEPPPAFEEPVLRHADTSFIKQTGLGQYFDIYATLQELSLYSPKPPYDLKFEGRTLIAIYGMNSRSGVPIGKLYLEMISTYSRHPEERAKVSAFLMAMEKVDLDKEPREPKPKQPSRAGRKLWEVCYK